MKNFARLLRFAWPYRVRFGLSIVCAMLVALFWGANLGAVYPLLQILFRSENSQHWIAEKVESSTTEVACHEARLEELRYFRAATDLRDPLVKGRMKELIAARDREQEVVRGLKAKIVENVAEGEARTLMPPELVVSESQARALRIAEARIEEVGKALAARQEGRLDRLDRRIEEVSDSRDRAENWLAIYQRAQPFINEWLPRNGFRTLLMLIGLVMIG
ncbi:MAG: hypothetical protein SFX72_07430 [Isosphaeraceae bacterium]|nr:hypothetical protein [Isosphaeraceae bacterium]